ncbi:hypothetical protein ACFZAB_34375 [Streptomyces albogriseolus]|uniref:hypothetical protein n=1 Tax=Streptomyces albogriseolus TaxID=1887 RepID=UPI002259C0C3|nr:hypothetical protein [Streptomyces viridodiastaticus]MCX4618023.1 hypothetical protein [Streptomyces viridodiastaticus]
MTVVAIADEWAQDDSPLRHQRIEDARQSAGVLRVCTGKRVPLLFLWSPGASGTR